MNRTLKAAIAAALLLPAFAQADGFSYNYVEAGVARTEYDVPGGDGDAVALRGSLAIAPNWHLFAGAEQVNFGRNVDGRTYDVGVGFNYSLTGSLDAIAQAAWVKADGDLGDEDGYGIRAMLRGAPMERVEVEGGVQYVDFGDNADNTSFVVAGRYSFTDAMSAGLGLSLSDDVNSYGVNFRFKFK